jgi:hypothetical protein
MKKKTYIIIGILTLIIALFTIGYFVLLGLSGMGSPTGGRGPNYPYFITLEPTTIKNILVPKGTKLTYEEQFFKEGQQDKIMNEEKLTSIELPEGKTIDWGNVPVFMILKFFNSEMRGYTVYADFNQLSNDKKTKFSELWQSSDNELGIDVKNIGDWSFNKQNITDVESCGVNNQRYFKEDKSQQQFLDSLMKELLNIKQN